MSTSAKQKQFKALLAQTTPYPMMLEVKGAEGVFIYSTSGQKYYDMVAGVAVSQVGHQHPRVIDALKEQAGRYLHTMVYGEFIQDVQTAFAQKIVAHLPSRLNMVYLLNSGTEANEAALKLAKRVTGRHKLVSCRGAYHGSTHGSLSVSDNEERKRAFRPLLPNVEFIGLNDFNSLKTIDTQTAAIILETIQGDAGVRIPDKKWMQALRQRCNNTGTLLILDEIQCGTGRTGRFSAFTNYDIEPDILTLGKALGGGMPIGAMVASRRLMLEFTHDPMLGHLTTFGGHPMPCAAGSAMIDVLDESGSIEQATDKGRFIENALTVDGVKAIRRMGLMLAMDFEDGHMAQAVLEECLARGVILFRFLSCPYSLRLTPPLTINYKELEDACSIIKEAIAGVANTAG